MSRELGAARIGDHQLGAVPDRVLDPRCSDWMIDDGVCADQQNDVGLEHVHHRIRYRARADAFQQRCNTGCVAKARAVIDVVRAKSRAHEFLKQIRLFVRSFRGAESCERVRPLRVANALQRAPCECQCLVPARFAKHRPWIRRINREVGGFRRVGFSDQRLRQPMRMRRVIEAVTSFDAEAPFVRRTVAPVDAYDRVVLHVISKLTTDSAIGACGVDCAIDGRKVRVARRCQRAGRACLHALTAGDTGGRAHRIVQIENGLRCGAAKRVADHVVHLLFAAGAYTTRALDAGVEVDRHRGVRQIRRGLRTSRKTRRADVEHIAPVIELGIGLVHTLGHVGGEKLQHHLLGMTRAFACTLNVHAGRRSAAA